MTCRHGWAGRPGVLVPVLAIGLTGAHAVLAKAGGPNWLAWYLDDFFCLPLVLGLVVAAQRRIHRDPGWVLPLWHGVAALVLYSVYFEVILPRLRPAAVGDHVDPLVYGLGLLVFQLSLNRPRRHAAAPSGLESA